MTEYREQTERVAAGGLAEDYVSPAQDGRLRMPKGRIIGSRDAPIIRLTAPRTTVVGHDELEPDRLCSASTRKAGVAFILEVAARHNRRTPDDILAARAPHDVLATRTPDDVLAPRAP